MDYRTRITIEPGKRSGKPCIRGLRITVYDILNMLAEGMSYDEIIDDFPKITKEDILACLSFAAEREQNTFRLSAWDYYLTTTCHINYGIAEIENFFRKNLIKFTHFVFVWSSVVQEQKKNYEYKS